jgi:hypothetical protein
LQAFSLAAAIGAWKQSTISAEQEQTSFKKCRTSSECAQVQCRCARSSGWGNRVCSAVE